MRSRHSVTLASAMVLTAALVGLPLALTSAASATPTPTPYSSLGPGYAQIVDGKLAPLGAYIPDGDRSVLVYCGELGKEGPWSDTNRAGDVAWSGVSADDNARVNAVVSTFGQQRDNNVTAAVQAFVWEKVDHQAYVEHGSSAGLIRDRVPAAQQQAVKNDLATIRAAAAKVTAASAKPSGKLAIALDTAHPDRGTVTVSGTPTGTAGTLTLTNGVFQDTNTATLSGARAGNTYPVKGLSAADGDVNVTAKVSGSFVIAPPKGWDDLFQGTVGEWSAGAGQQHTIGPSKKGPKAFTLAAATTASTVFKPVVGTTVDSRYVKKGAPFRDRWEFDVAAGSNPWRQLTDGSYLPVTATGTLYGPFASKPAEADVPPADAPIAAHATLTTTAKDGPTGTYTAEADTTASKSGYYTWVVTITGAEQAPRTKENLPKDYAFADRFGQAIETHLVPTEVQFGTKLDKSTVEYGGTVTDTITPRLADTEDQWVTGDDGNPIPVRIRGTAYYSKARPTVAAQAPADAEVVGHLTGTLNSLHEIVSDPLTVPTKAGFVTVQWCTDTRTKNYEPGIIPFCDQYGVPSETVEIIPPTVTSTAQASAQDGDTVTDTAHINGPVPAAGLDVTFEGYLQPETVTRTGQVTTGNAVCTRDNRIMRSTSPVLASTPGSYTSEQFDTTGILPNGRVIAWVETARLHGTTQTIHTGICGTASELTGSNKPAPKVLAFTGTTMPFLLIGGGAVLAALIGLTLIWARRRRTTTTTAAAGAASGNSPAGPAN